MSEEKEVMLKAAKEAGRIIQYYFQGTFKINNKGSVNNLVTEVDNHSEKRIIDIIRETYPDHTIISEEAGEMITDSDYQWIIDPIDGTVNFAHGIPICCVSIGLKYKDQMMMGVVYNPLMNELFFAEKDKGATLNGQVISVSEKDDFKKACLVTGFPYKWPKTYEHPIKVFERFIMEGLPVRRLGSAAIDLCWVACGRFDGFWEYNLNPWDIAAGYLIVEEAGGIITNFDGDPYNVNDKETLATNGLIHSDMLKIIRSKI
ncbi:MAG: inositol monophosphatase [Chitinophagales bacterium]|nr:inositol monophosphatase [Chitinophagaceae bacterium]MCB9065880.1 inositol monophosphatase [Chitinophagales bacterium]